jgi:hypothetical protein
MGLPRSAQNSGFAVLMPLNFQPPSPNELHPVKTKQTGGVPTKMKRKYTTRVTALNLSICSH